MRRAVARRIAYDLPTTEPPVIVDCHTHLNRYFDEQPPSLNERYAQLRGEMDANGIDFALVLSSYKVNEDRPCTADILRLVEDDPRIGVAAGVSFYDLGEESLAELRGLLGSGRVHALKLYPGYQAFYVYDPQLRGVYDLAAEFGVPVMVHTGRHLRPAWGSSSTRTRSPSTRRRSTSARSTSSSATWEPLADGRGRGDLQERERDG
jgi:predicted TIM-barrel fold metal-dependent hydrolase